MNKYYKKWYDKKENREKRLAYLKEWRKKNKEHVKEYQQSYYLKKIIGGINHEDNNGTTAEKGIR